ncbi:MULTISPECIES: Re/Si-specific NAD(P)(+) transhydrogenase subunit alpha [unclassified Janibacter]|uniref:Re/Si-specific NAD(P)(+) transhydrogenase subunit alpha n=1 Tax=unclassified Janibacter TaxID=2649294 RepID=UPI003D05F40D
MRIGVPQESRPGETRVAVTPRTVAQLVALGHEVVVQAGAGLRATHTDDAYLAAGAGVADPGQVWSSEVILKINAPNDEELGLLRPGTVLACLLAPALNPGLVEALAARGVTALAMDAVPRISRAQSLDVLSSMANIAGYRAVIEAAHEFGSLFTGQVTAAGKVPPATVLVCGAGVAGLAAIGTAGSLGAIVRAVDVRPEVAEQVESLGARFLPIEFDEQGPSSDGYAKATSAAFDERAAALYAEQAREVDIIVTTALIPGRAAPRLITEEMVASMKPGSVIVDMAAGQGGNVAGSVADEVVVTPGGVTIIGYTDLPARLPAQASQLFGTNLANLMTLLTPAKDGHLVIDLEDVVQRGMTVTRDGEVLWPPPAIQVSAAPASPVNAPPAAAKASGLPGKTAPVESSSPARKFWAIGVAAALYLVIARFAPAEFLGHVTVFALAVVIGFYVIGNVAHALHTPLMSVTNAISGIIVVGALTLIEQEGRGILALAFVAVLLASINVFGGFTVTHRMLTMFRRA